MIEHPAWLNRSLPPSLEQKLLACLSEVRDPAVPPGYAIPVYFEAIIGMGTPRAIIELPFNCRIRAHFADPLNLPTRFTRNDVRKYDWWGGGSRLSTTRIDEARNSILAEAEAGRISIIPLPAFRFLWDASVAEIRALQAEPYSLCLGTNSAAGSFYIGGQEVSRWVKCLAALRGVPPS